MVNINWAEVHRHLDSFTRAFIVGAIGSLLQALPTFTDYTQLGLHTLLWSAVSGGLYMAAKYVMEKTGLQFSQEPLISKPDENLPTSP